MNGFACAFLFSPFFVQYGQRVWLLNGLGGRTYSSSGAPKRDGVPLCQNQRRNGNENQRITEGCRRKRAHKLEGNRNSSSPASPREQPHMSSDRLTIGVLCLQGTFEEHIAMLNRCGCDTAEVRFPRDMDGVDGMVLPGGESTALAILGESSGMFQAIRTWVSRFVVPRPKKGGRARRRQTG
jgi:hypothetical protein